MRRMTDNDRTLGPFTLGPWTKTFSVMLSSDGEDDDTAQIRLIAFGWALRIKIPSFIPPLRIKHTALSWDAETIKRLGRNWYYEIHQREFGISLSDMGNGYDFLQVHFGAQAHDSSTTKSWCKHLPWKQWSHVRHSLYNPDGTHFYTEDTKAEWSVFFRKRDDCPACHFGFEDYDGELIVATCRIEEREWHKGSGWFRWLKCFSKPKICRSLDIKFSAEVGTEKGSWKGGTVGHGIDMQPGENPEQAFRRYCQMDHERKGRHYRLRFIGPCGPPPKNPVIQSDAETQSAALP